jgi:hypothetical protein
MVRARIFLALAFLAAIFVATAMTLDSGGAAQSGCADFVCADIGAGGVCQACKGDSQRSDASTGAACTAVCAAMTAMVRVPAQIIPAAPRNTDSPARSTPGGIPVAPERAPPRASIPA